ncbi:MAG: EscU/YscU/HrcU family type III secretion system export apparatus switch protein [Aureliella sp.]
MSDSAERKHQPTPLRRKKAYEQGQFARSQDLAVAFSFIGAAAILWVAGPGLVAGLRGILNDAMSLSPANFHEGEGLLKELSVVAIRALWLVAPLIGGIFFFSAVQAWTQNRFQFFAGGLKLDIARLSPAARIRQMLSGQTSTQLLFSILKVAAVFSIVVYRINQGGLLPFADNLQGGEMEYAAGVLGEALIRLTLEIGCVLLLLGCADYAVQWYRNEQSLRMTDEELRQELKESSTDPGLVRRRRDLRAKMAD